MQTEGAILNGYPLLYLLTLGLQSEGLNWRFLTTQITLAHLFERCLGIRHRLAQSVTMTLLLDLAL